MDATFETDFKGNTYADDAVLTDELNQLVSDGALCVALAVGLEVTQVTDVADLVLGGTVVLAVGVDWYVCQRVSWGYVHELLGPRGWTTNG